MMNLFDWLLLIVIVVILLSKDDYPKPRPTLHLVKSEEIDP
jgi:hypothetical protein